MSVSTHLHTLRAFRQWVRSNQPPDMLLERALAAIRDIDETASALRLYQVNDHQLSLSYTTQKTDTSSVQVNPKVTPSHSQALTLRKPVYDHTGGVWVLPVDSVQTAYGLLEVAANAPASEQEADMEAAFLLIAEAMGQALDLWAFAYNNIPPEDITGPGLISSREVSERQTRAFNEIVIGQTLANMATVVARHMLPEADRHLAIHEIFYDSMGQAQDWNALERQDSRPRRALEISITWDDLSSELRTMVEDAETLYIDDLKNATVSTIGDKLYRWLSTQNMRSLIICPISVDNRAVAVLTVTSQREAAFTPEEVNAFRNLADQMGVLSKVRQLLDQARQTRNIVDNVALANRLVTVASDYSYIAQGISYTIAREMLAVSITLFDHPISDDDPPEFRRIVGLSTKDEIIEVDSDLERDDIPEPDQITRMQNSLPLVFKALDSRDSFLSEASRETYDALGARWMVSFGLRTENQILGVMDILHDDDYQLSQEEIDAFTTLADQIGMNIRSRQLFEDSRIAHDMAAQLVETNSQIAVADDYTEMASAVIHSLPENIEMVGIMLFDEPISAREMPQWIKAEVLASREEILTPGIIDYLSTDNVTVLRTIKSLIDGEMLLIGDARDLTDDVLGETTAFLVDRGLYSFAALALRTGSRLLGVIAFCARSIESLNTLQLGNLRAIAGQVGIAIENRNLLNQTADALSFVAAQYEMSNAMYRAKTPQEMLSILYRFSEEVYEKALVGMIEEDETSMRVLAQIDTNNEHVNAEENTLYTLRIPKEVQETEEHTIVSEDRTKLLLPLVTTSNDLVGVVQFINPEPVEMPFNQLRALRSLADQMALALENRALLQKTDRTLKETLTVYEISQMVSASKDSLDVLQNVRRTVAHDAVSLALVNVEYDIITDSIDGLTLYSLVTDTVNGRIKVDLHKKYGDEILEPFAQRWDVLKNEVEFKESLSADDIKNDPVLRYLSEQNVKIVTSVTLPIFSEGLLVQLVNIVFAKPRRFTTRERRLYTALRDQVTIVLENHRLLLDIRTSAAQLGNQVRILQSLNQLASNLSTAQNESTLLEEAAQAMANATGVDHVGVTLLNGDGRSATVVAEYPPMGAVGVIINEENPLQKEIISSRQPMFINDVKDNDELEDSAREQLMEMGIQRLMIFPMVDLKEYFLGTFGLDVYREDFAFTPEMIEVARNITSQVVVSLQNVRQFQNTQRQAEQLQRLAEFSQLLQTQLQIESIIENVAVHTPEIVAADYVNVYQFDLQEAQLNLTYQFIEGETQRVDPEQTPSLEGTTALEAWQRRDILSIKNLELHTDYRFTTNDHAKSVMAIPYFSRGIAIGMIEIGHRSAFIHTETDQIIFRQLVNQIGIASENTEAYTQSQRIARSKAKVNEISSQLQEQVDVSSILNVTVQELGRALGARRGRIRLGSGDNGTEQKR